jgi:WD40 repeat protein
MIHLLSTFARRYRVRSERLNAQKGSLIGLRWSAAFAALIFAAVPVPGIRAAESAPKGTISVAHITRSTPVDFDHDVLPLLKANCLACHNRSKSKADLILETPADLLKGGESGPAVVAGKSQSSLLLTVSTHEAKPRMPPKDNKVNAEDMTPEQLGIIARWIDEGARASEKHEEAIAWQVFPRTISSIYASALTIDGRWAACGRGNQLFVYDLTSGSPPARLEDPALLTNPPILHSAHRDWVNALAFSPDGRMLASGGFREVKIWIREPLGFVPAGSYDFGASSSNRVWRISQTQRVLTLLTNASVEIATQDGKRLTNLSQNPELAIRDRTIRMHLEVARSTQQYLKSRLETAGKDLESQKTRLAKAVETEADARKVLLEKERTLSNARSEFAVAEGRYLRLAASVVDGVPTQDAVRQAKEKMEAASKVHTDAESNHKQASQKLSTAQHEQDLAAIGIARSEGLNLELKQQLKSTQSLVSSLESEVKALEESSNKGLLTTVSIAVSPDGKTVATVQSDGTIRLWSTVDGEPLDSIHPQDEVPSRLAFATPTQLMAQFGSGVFKCEIAPKWSLRQVLGTSPGNSEISDRVNSLAFSPDGSRLASGGGEPSRSGEIIVWDTASGAKQFALNGLHSDTVTSLAFSPDGALLASGGADRFARIADIATGHQLRFFEGHTGHVLGVAWSFDGRVLATAGADGVVKFWDAATAEKRKQSPAVTREVTAVAALGRSGQWVAASGEGELRVLNENGDKVRSLAGTGDFTYAISATQDGKRIAAGGQDGVLRVWEGEESKPRFSFEAVERVSEQVDAR